MVHMVLRTFTQCVAASTETNIHLQIDFSPDKFLKVLNMIFHIVRLIRNFIIYLGIIYITYPYGETAIVL